MASIRARIYKYVLRRTIKNNIFGNGIQALNKVRARENGASILTKIIVSDRPGIPLTIGNIQAEWVGNQAAQQTLLYLHGGGYVFGSINTHRSLVSRICADAGLRGLIIDYRLAPENPFPAAIEDAEQAYDYLIETGSDPRNIVIAGDSAGGGLALALMQKLGSHKKPQPQAAVLFSPWTDLTLSGASHRDRAERDPMINVNRIPEAIKFYCHNEDASNPLISPLFADLSGFPPMLVQVGTEEVLFDDATRLVENAKKVKCPVELQVWQDMPHVHQLAHKFVPEARAAVRGAAMFLKNHIST